MRDVRYRQQHGATRLQMEITIKWMTLQRIGPTITLFSLAFNSPSDILLVFVGVSGLQDLIPTEIVTQLSFIPRIYPSRSNTDQRHISL